MDKFMQRENLTLFGRRLAEPGNAQAREIVEARLRLIADLEQRRRLPCDGEPRLCPAEASRYHRQWSGEGT